jgi:hypothetical protein
MKPLADHLSDQFLDEELASALRHLPPHERRELRRSAFTEWADERGNERTVPLSVRVPLTLALRLDIERGTLKRRLGRRRLTRSEAIRILLTDALALGNATQEAELGEEPIAVPEQRAA